ncbi:serine protease filzig [Halyomorpha halys]|uniref:serine protease filzig n=1 Tax=Halyomorpha halys TaxID=286706 RepID=UPI0006D4EE2B|nr:serine proteinase stubble [Halyomorpha halys]
MEERMDWRLLLCFWLATALPPPATSLSPIYKQDQEQGRRFGGYRIVPKACKDLTSLGKGTGICMFNLECSKKNGTVVGSCMDGFLFGTCCKLPDTFNFVGIPLPSGSSTERTRPATTTAHGGSTVAIHGSADTVLLHENGTIANEAYRPEDFEFNYRPQLFVATDATTQPSVTRHETHPQKSTTWSTTESSWPTKSRPWIEDNLVQIPTLSAGGQGNAESINHILSILDDNSPLPEPQILNKSETSTTPTLSTWVSVDSKPTSGLGPTTQSYMSSKSPTPKPTYKPSSHYYSSQRPYTSSYQTTHQQTYPSSQSYPSSQTYPGSQSYPTSVSYLPSHTYSSTANRPVSASYPTSHISLDTGSQNLIISSQTHVTSPKPYLPPSTSPSTTYYPSSSSTGYPSTSSSHYSSSTPSYVPLKPQTIYTKKPSSTIQFATHNKPSYITKKPSTTTQYIQGPSFQVSITPKPISSTPEPPPTVIVLGPYPTKKPIQAPRPPGGTIITVNPDGQVVTYKPTTAAKPPHQTAIHKPPSTTLRPPLTSQTPSTLYKPIHSYTTPTQVIKDSIANSTEVLVAFPPVRDPSPNANHSAEGRPEVITWNTQPTPPLEETTAHLVEDQNLDNKVHKFVEKIVQSLQGNFEDLEHVLIDGQSTPNVTVSQSVPPVKRPSSTTTKKPTRRPTKKPTAGTSSTRPKPVTSPLITRPPTRPTTNKKPLTTKRPPSSTTIFLEDTDQYSPSSESPSSSYVPPIEVDFKRECGVRPLLKNGRIVGGKGATFGEWPWQVLVREATWLGLFTKNKCGGVLITNKYVITAAHCQPGFLASLIAVFGEYDISGELESKRSVTRPVRRVIVHRLYDAATFENDIALLELDSPVQFDQHIVPICMPKDNEDFTGRIATVTGWGRLKYGGGVPSVLQEVQVPVMENAVCQEMFHTAGHAKTILNSFICAGYANGQRDSCEGDSGGPLMIERPDGHWALAGTVSHGIKCAAPYLPGVYMRTTYYKPWLQTITGVKDN